MISDAYYRAIRPHAICTAPIASLLKSLSSLCSIVEDRAMAQVGSRWPFTEEAQVRYYASPCGICGQQNGTGTFVSPHTSVSTFSVIPPVLHTHIELRCFGF